MLRSLADLKLMTLLLDAHDYTLVFAALTSIKRRSRTTPTCFSQDMSQTFVHLGLCLDTMLWPPPLRPTVGRYESVNSGVRYA